MHGEVDLCGHGGASFSSLLKGHSSYYTVGPTVAFVLRPPFPGAAHGPWLSTLGIPGRDHPCPRACRFAQGPPRPWPRPPEKCAAGGSSPQQPGPASQAGGPALSCSTPAGICPVNLSHILPRHLLLRRPRLARLLCPPALNMSHLYFSTPFALSWL